MADHDVPLKEMRSWSRRGGWTEGCRLYECILYFGSWASVLGAGGRLRRSNTQYNAFEFSFRGPAVKWIGSKGSDHGCADVYIDGEFQQSVDCYSAEAVARCVKFEKDGLVGDRIHTLRVVVRKERNPAATDCYQDVSAVGAVSPLSYTREITAAMNEEYARIQDGTKEYLAPEEWSPVANAAEAPVGGVALGDGVLRDAFNRNIDYLNHCFACPTLCDGTKWPQWLPASNEGRMLAGAAHTLRWGEREDMRAIVDTLVARIEDRMREDGYYNYYPESDSYQLDTGSNSERKNYDRVFWTRGLLAAGIAGNPNAYGLLRRMYDWFNASPYIPRVLLGSNATNALPGGPLMHLSPAGKDEDLVVTERYYDQDYWMKEMANREPLCLSHYPGERPHCYDLLALETLVDEYRATGARKYIDAVLGGWDIYRDNYKHVGGATAIMEYADVFPPRSYYFTEHSIGETCGSVFWININAKLMHLYPDREEYAAEIEEAIVNVILANQDSRGYIRYHTALQGVKHDAACRNCCCEVAAAGLIPRLPGYIYSIAPDGLYVNLFAASSITWPQDGDDVTLSTTTGFPLDPKVSMTISTAVPKAMNIRIRVPSWSTGPMPVLVNGSEFASGTPGAYLPLEREWEDGDTISFTLPMGFRAVRYTGLDQLEGNPDRYALMYGPVLMAFQGELTGPGGVPRIEAQAEDLAVLLNPAEGDSMEYGVKGHPGYRYVPYWRLKEDQPFTCFPVIER